MRAMRFPPCIAPALMLVAAWSGAAAKAQRTNPPIALEFRQHYELPKADEQSRAIVRAARVFLEGLDPELRSKVLLPFSDNNQRANWSNLPERMAPRAGVQIGELTKGGEGALLDLLTVLLGPAGVRNVELQMAADEALGNPEMFQRDFYKIAFLGHPSESEPWMLQFGGHHLAINATVFGPWVGFAPMLTGGQPTRISYRGEEVYLLEEEVDAAHALLNSLRPEQKQRAVLSPRAINLLLGPGDDDVVLAPEGLAASDLDPVQRDLLIALIDARLELLNEDDRGTKREQVIAELTQTWFGWWGPEAPKGTGYFRVTAPSLVLEYAPQGRRHPEDHVHSMYREPGNDYGAAWLGADPE